MLLRRHRFLKKGLGFAALIAVGFLLYLLWSGRLFLRYMPEFVRYRVLAELYEPCVSPQSANEFKLAYQGVIERLGVDYLLELHQNRIYEPYTSFALGFSNNEEAVARLKEEALTQLEGDTARGRPVTTNMALLGYMVSTECSAQVLSQMHDAFPDYNNNRISVIAMVVVADLPQDKYARFLMDRLHLIRPGLRPKVEAFYSRVQVQSQQQ